MNGVSSTCTLVPHVLRGCIAILAYGLLSLSLEGQEKLPICDLLRKDAVPRERLICLKGTYSMRGNGFFDQMCAEPYSRFGRTWPPVVYVKFPTSDEYSSWLKKNETREGMSPDEFNKLLTILFRLNTKITIDATFCGYLFTIDNSEIKEATRLGVPPGGFGDQDCCPAEMAIREVHVHAFNEEK